MAVGPLDRKRLRAACKLDFCGIRRHLLPSNSEPLRSAAAPDDPDLAEVASLDFDCLSGRRVHDVHLFYQRLGYTMKGLGIGRILVKSDWPAIVALNSDPRIERYLAKEWEAQLLGRFARASMAENIITMPAMGARIITHILDDSQNRDVQFLEHRDRF